VKFGSTEGEGLTDGDGDGVGEGVEAAVWPGAGVFAVVTDAVDLDAVLLCPLEELLLTL
jgi:hypothetical protein